jgi:FMN phosphatase YigB (HAD superfamily)
MDLPMPPPTNPPRPLNQYEVLSFDIYGSIIEYKSHILNYFHPLLSRLPPSSPYIDSTPSSNIPGAATVGSLEFLKIFQQQEDTIKLELAAHPRRFDEILIEIWHRVAAKLEVSTTEEEGRQFGSEAKIASWPTFPGTLEALQSLSKHYKLIALSNIDKFAWEITASSPNSRLGDIHWFKVFTAEDFGNDLRRVDDAKIETMLEFCKEQGLDKEKILHVAQSLGHDQAPAKRAGLSSVWLVGDGFRWKGTKESKMALEKGLVGYAWRCEDLKVFANLVEEAFAKQL